MKNTPWHLILVVCALLFFASCATGPAVRAVDADFTALASKQQDLVAKYEQTAADGVIDATEMPMLSSAINAAIVATNVLAQSVGAAMQQVNQTTPPTGGGTPAWMLWASGLLGIAATGYGAYKKTVGTAVKEVNEQRDAARVMLGEPATTTAIAPAAVKEAVRRRRRGEPIQPATVVNVGPHS